MPVQNVNINNVSMDYFLRGVEAANKDDNIVSKRLLGSGSAGSVYELTRSDGKQVVFKIFK